MTYYAALSAVIAVPLLIPFADLGAGASLLNVAAAGDRERLDRTFSAAIHRTLISAGLILLAALAATMFQIWPSMLGSVGSSIPGLSAAAFLLTATFAVSIPLGLGRRLLVAGGRIDLSTWFYAIQPVLTLVIIASSFLLTGTASSITICIAYAAGAILPGAVQMFFGMRTCGLAVPSYGEIFRKHDPALLKGMATPMIVVSTAFPLSFQCARWILGHEASIRDVILYAAILQLFTTGLAIINTVGQLLWSIFAKDRENQHRQWFSAMRIALLAASVLAGGWLIGAPLVISYLTNHKVHLPFALSLLAAMALFIEMVHQPSGMLLTTPAGMGFQARTCLIAGVGAVAGTALLASSLGAEAPFVSLLVCYGSAQVLPCFLRARKQSLPGP